MDVALNSAGDDLDTTGGRLTFVRGPEATAQSIAFRLGFWRGESLYDRTAGLPLLQAILGRHPADAVAFFFEAEIEATPGVRGLVEPLDLQFDGETRRLTGTGRVRLISGEILPIGFVSVA